jgi:putative transposase
LEDLTADLVSKVPQQITAVALPERWPDAIAPCQAFSISTSTDNAFIEAFNSKLRSECLNAHWFLSLEDACEELEAWRRHYNEERPHIAIGNIPPIMLANSAGETSPPDLSKAENSRPEWSKVGWQCKQPLGTNPSWGKAGGHLNTPKRAAAARQLMPSFVAATTRSRKS